MIDVLMLLVLIVIAAALVILAWRGTAPRLHALPNEIWRDALTNRVQMIISGLSEDQHSHGLAIEHLSEVTARLDAAVTDLRSVIDRLTLPCAACPARETARRVERIERALEMEDTS